MAASLRAFDGRFKPTKVKFWAALANRRERDLDMIVRGWRRISAGNQLNASPLPGQFRINQTFSPKNPMPATGKQSNTLNFRQQLNVHRIPKTSVPKERPQQSRS
jgi:hypothetical protein